MRNSIRIIMINEDPADRRLIRGIIEDGLDNVLVLEIDNRSELGKALAKSAYDLILTEHKFKDFTGLDVIRDVQEHGLGIPIIMLADTAEDDMAVEAIKLGINDFVIKSLKHLKGLPAKIAKITERKTVEKALTELQNALSDKEINYQELFDTSSDIVQVVLPDGSFVYTNPAWRDCLGYNKKEALKLNLFDVIHQDSQTHCREVFEALLRKEQVDRICIDYVCRDGRVITVEGVYNCHFKDDRPILIHGIFTIVHGETSTDEPVMAVDNSPFISAFESSPIGVIIYNKKRTIIHVNPAICKILDYGGDELIGNSISDLMHPDEVKSGMESLDRLFVDEVENFQRERRYRHKKGHYIWGDLIVSLVRDNTSRPQYGLVQFSDITARKQAEIALQKQTALTQLLGKIGVSANEATSIEDVLQSCLSEVCNYTGWSFGHAYMVVDDTEKLVSAKEYYVAEPEQREIFQQTSAIVLSAPGQGLPGRVRRSRNPIWISDIAYSKNYPGAEVILENGIRAIYAFPIRIKQEVVAVMEFMCSEVTGPDFDFLDIMDHIGIQVGRVIERKRAEESLLSSEEKFSTAFRSSPDQMVISTIEEGRIIDVNDTFLKEIGYSRHEVIGRTSLELDIWADPVQRTQLLNELRCYGYVHSMEVNLRHISGEEFVCLLSAEVIEIGGERYMLINGSNITSRKRAELELERYKHIVNATDDMMAFVDSSYIYCAVNQRYLDAFRMGWSDVVGKSVFELTDSGNFLDISREKLDNCLAGKSINFQNWFELPGLGNAFLDIVCSPYRDATGNVAGVVISGHDITERKQAEEELYRSNRALQVLSECNHAIVHATTGQELINEICRIIVDAGGYRFAWVGYAQADKNKMVYPVASAGHEAGYLDNDFNWQGARKPFDPVSDVIRTGKPFIVKNLTTDPVYESLRNAALERGYRSEIALPLNAGDKAFGALMIYSSEPEAFDVEEESLLVRLANDLAYGILSMHTRSEHERAEQSLRESENKYRLLYDEHPSMFFTVDTHGAILSVNKFGAQELGYAVEELLGRSFFDLSFPSHKLTVEEQLRLSVDNPKQLYNWEQKIIRKNGTHMWAKDSARMVTDTDGSDVIFIVCEDITETHKLSEQLTYQATHDALTGLINRKEFERRLQRMLDAAHLENGQHTLCYMDIEQFKLINDSCGHTAGDELLRQLSMLMQDKVRKRDTIARLGGDEFAIMMEYCHIGRAEQVARKLIHSIADFRFHWEGKSFMVAMNTGLVPIDESSGDIKEILKRADVACYIAKNKGKNHIYNYVDEDKNLKQKQKGEDVNWVEQIQEALEEDLFQLYFQPIVPLHQLKDDIKHYEVLVRMETRKGELIEPDTFLPAAEHFNLLSRLDRWVINSLFNLLACLQQDKHMSQYSVNLSGRSLGEDNFLEYVNQQFEESLIPHEKICFEITETVAITNLSSALKFIKTLKERGCRFALDDFGTGLSSFSYLKNLQVDYLKIDGEFIKGITEDSINHAIVKSMHEIGKALGKQTVAEYVENKEAYDILCGIGIDYAQGSYIGEVLSSEEMLMGGAAKVMEFVKR